jgi:NapC/NirT cytochrome c family, N-terminal region
MTQAADLELPVKWGSALDWATTLTIALGVLILACIVTSRLLYRNRQTEGNALWLHLLGLGAFPLFLVAVGNFAVLEGATEVKFCGACHLTMKPYIADLHNPKSQSLASLHFQNRFARGTECYACHANYGIHGTMQAKLTGLRHVYKYWTGTYRLPLTLPTPYENELCLKCHNGAKRFMAEEIHLDVGEVSKTLRTGETECIGCNAPAHDVPKPKQAGRPGGAA